MLEARERELQEEVRTLKEAGAERPGPIGRQAEDDVEHAEERFRAAWAGAGIVEGEKPTDV